MRILITSGDTLTAKHEFSKENPSFVFIHLGEEVFYFDTTIGKMWKTTKPSLKGLGLNHKKLIRSK